MTLNDTLANAMIAIKNAETVGHSECWIRPASKLIREVLRVMQQKGYIGDFEEIEDGRDKMFRVGLIGKINNCRAIKPRIAINRKEFEEFEKQFLPAKGMGTIIISTNEGVTTVEEARGKKIGGRL